MRSSALLSLLPFLATLPLTTLAHSHHHHEHSVASQRKSLSFGPSLTHATYSTQPENAQRATLLGGEIDPKAIAIDYIRSQVRDEFYVRDDSYTDPRTGVTHIYAKQLVNGLEVADGDLNVNVDADGTILSFGSSFHPGDAPAFEAAKVSSGQISSACDKLDALMRVHKQQLADLKTRKHNLKHSKHEIDDETKIKLREAKMESKAIHRHMAHLRDHLKALCEPGEGVQGLTAEQGLKSPANALLSLLPRLHAGEADLAPLDRSGLSSHHITRLAPSHAPNEPPTEIISGPTLAAAGVVSHVPARLVYSQIDNDLDPVRLTWKFEVEMQHNWYEAYVDAETLEVIRLVDWASDSPLPEQPRQKRGLAEFMPAIISEAGQAIFGKGGKQKPFPVPTPEPSKAKYGVFPWGINDPECGNVTVVKEPWDTIASPAGWHSFPKQANPWAEQGLDGMKEDGAWSNFTTTIGNNVIAHEDWEGQNNWLHNYRPKNETLSFVYPYLEPDGLRPKEYIDMVVTQLFYTCNMYHDLLYRLGFDEISGNFQMFNFDKGGRGGDAIIANAQDGSGYNNANFMTPPDGQMGRMRMYVWDTSTPFRDGDLEAGIVIHEYSHGLSTRLVGGPANSGCLGYGEAGGMGEGWGDAMATFIRQIEQHHKHGGDVFSMGAYAANREQGIRNYKYATNSTINPSTYKTLDKPGYWGVHAIGEVHAEILFVIEEALIKKHGFSKTLFPPLNATEPNDYYRNATAVAGGGKAKRSVPQHGNTLSIQLIVDSLKLLPCRPTFLNHRDSFLQAERILTGGENQCEIWQAFADRGLGPDAKLLFQTPWGAGQRSEDYTIPKGVCAKK